VRVSQDTFDALVSFTYNVGAGAFRTSTLLKKLNAGDTVGACNQLPRWNKAGGKVLPGLTRRRAAEQALCLKGA
jgi:lysozyme